MADQTKLSEAISAFQGGDLGRARAIAEDELRSSRSPQFRHLLGLIDCRAGNFDEGIRSLRQAYEEEPANIAFQMMLVRALIDAGRASEALRWAEPPAGTSPAELLLWQAMAQAAAAAGDHGAASEAWAVLCSARRDDPQLWVNLARSHLPARRYDEAERAYEQALALAPRDTIVLRELGLTYHRNNRYDRLAELLDSASGAGLPKEELAYLWALRAFRDGDMQSAGAILPAARNQVDAPRWQRLRAKIADAAGDFDEAFAASEAMNGSVPNRERWAQRARAHRQEIRDLADALGPEWAEGLPRLAPLEERQAPAFLVGFPRSGTTLVDTFIMGHPRAAVLEERPLLVESTRSLGPLAELPERSRHDLEEARRNYLSALSRLDIPPGRLPVDKFPLNLAATPLIQALFPGAPILFVQRHPCDVVLSAFMRNFQPNVGMASFLSIEDAADLYDLTMRVWTASCELFPLNRHTIVYEQLVEDPEPILRGLFAFLGMEWEDRLLDHRQTARSRGPVSTASFAQIVEPLGSGSIGRWRNYEHHLRPVLPKLLNWAHRLGYPD